MKRKSSFRIHTIFIILLALVVLLSFGCSSEEAKRKRQEVRAQEISDSLMQVAQDSVDYFQLVNENYFSGKVINRNLLTDEEGGPVSVSVHAQSDSENYYFRIDNSFPASIDGFNRYIKYHQFQKAITYSSPSIPVMYHRLSKGSDIIILSSKKFEPDREYTDIGKSFVHNNPNTIPETYQDIILRPTDLAKIVKK